MNSVNLIGRLTRDPELKYTQGKGTAVVKCNLAVRKNKDITYFPTVVIWGKTAEVVANYCLKGSEIGIINGELRTGSYEGKDGKKVYTTEVHTMLIDLLSKSGQAGNTSTTANNEYEDMMPVDDGEIPF